METKNLPKTRAEATAIGATHYFTGKPCKHGHIAPRKTKGACIVCIEIEWKAANEKRADYFAAYNKSDAGHKAKKKYYSENKELVVTKALSRSNEQRQQYRQSWKDKHPDEVRANNKHRRDKHKQATTKWLSKQQKKDIKQKYVDAMVVTRITGKQHVVDHIVPLRGENVCGLHVAWNLRVITQKENLAKSNKF